MKSASFVAKLPVMGVNEGEQVAVVEKILVGRQSKVVEYLSVNTGKAGVVPSLLPFADVMGIGQDYIVIQSADSIKKAYENDDLITAAEEGLLLTGASVLSSTGDLIDRIADYVIDEKTGEVAKLLLKGGQEVDGDRLLTLSAKFVFINADGVEPAAPVDEAPAEEPAVEEVVAEEVIVEEVAAAEEKKEAAPADGSDDFKPVLDDATLNFLIGQPVLADVRSDDGEFFVAEGTVLTEDILKDADKHGALLQVTMEI